MGKFDRSSGMISNFVERLGKKILKTATENGRKTGGWWHSFPLMAAASRAVVERIPLADFVLDVRDARIPMSSDCHLLKIYPPSSYRRITVLNKMDLADPDQLKGWMKYFDGLGFACCAVDSHNKVSIKQLLNLIQAKAKITKTAVNLGSTFTVLIVGIPNVGKSALVNSLHLVGRISAAEKGKMKHAIVSPNPGETQDICSFKIASHPNIYVLDTPGVLPSEILDLTLCSNLALTGALSKSYIAPEEVATYFLVILNQSNEYKKWERFSQRNVTPSTSVVELSNPIGPRQRRNDHTQDSVVHHVRGALYDAISHFEGKLQHMEDVEQLIAIQFRVLRNVLSEQCGAKSSTKVADKLLNLFNTGRLGRYTLESPDCITKQFSSYYKSDL